MMTAGRSRRTLASRIRAVLTDRLGYKAAALFLAVTLWIFVSAEEPTELEVPVRWSPRTDASIERVEGAPAFRARIAGRGRELLRLYASPPVLRPLINAGTAGRRHVDVRVSDVRLPPDVDAVVKEITPRSFEVAVTTRRGERTPALSVTTPLDTSHDSAFQSPATTAPDSARKP